MSELTPDQKRIFRETLEAKALAEAAYIPLHKHGAFDDLTAHLTFIQLASEALKGIGAMMLPEASHEDFQLNQARCTDASAIFRFFGEALEYPANEAYNAMERLQRAAKGELV